MSKKYINPCLILDAMNTLEQYTAQHPNDKTPLGSVAKNEPELSRAAYVCAARRLGWNITKTRGHVYENGYYIF